MSARPQDEEDLDLQSESRSIRDALRPLHERVEYTFIERARKNEFYHAMRDGEYHLIHFMGHGEFDSAAGKGVIVPEDDDGRGVEVGEDALAELLFDSPSTRLVVFNACETGSAADAKSASGVATSVARTGVPAVVSVQYSITDGASIHFSKELFCAS